MRSILHAGWVTFRLEDDAAVVELHWDAGDPEALVRLMEALPDALTAATGGLAGE